MFETAVIVFREALEAALIIGIVLAASRGVPGRFAVAGAGVLAGIVGAMVIAALAGAIGEAASGVGQEILNASILGAAVLMLGWHNVWMSRHGQAVASQMKSVGRGIAAGSLPLWVLASAIGLAVLREGAEIVLFLYGISAGGGSAGQMAVGGLAGLGAGVMVGVLLYIGILGIPLRHFFNVTGAMILFLASGLAAQSAGFLLQAGLVPALGEQLWDSSWLIEEQSLLGQFLKALIGYVANPSGIQILAYLLTFALIGGLMMTIGKRHPVSRSPALALLVSAIFATTLWISAPSQTQAAPYKVYSPNVDQGEAEVEYRGYHDMDNDAARDGGQKHKIGGGYGFTDFWFSEFYAGYENPPNGPMTREAFEWENRFQLTDQGEYFADFGFLIEYENAAHGGTDELKLVPIFEKTFDKWVGTANLIFERQIGSGASSGTVFAYGARAKYLMSPSLQPAVELFGETGRIGHSGDFNTQEHWIGPALYGSIGLGNKSKIGYSAAFLFGTTSVSSDNRAILRLEYEFY
ncbi:MAG: FTR1 family protein [Burkholderiales bacterium]